MRRRARAICYTNRSSGATPYRVFGASTGAKVSFPSRLLLSFDRFAVSRIAISFRSRERASKPFSPTRWTGTVAPEKEYRGMEQTLNEAHPGESS